MSFNVEEKLPAEFDGIVPICHTEGASQTDLNFPLVLRALSGFCVHPNIGALLIVDTIKDKFTATELVKYHHTTVFERIHFETLI